jgi:hypothetical protein
MDQATTQIWPPISSPQQIVSRTVTCSCFPRVARVTYDKQLLHGSKEDEAALVLYIYHLQHLQSPHEICVL